MSRPLAALLAALTLTSPAAAAECSLNAFSPAGVKAECATASSDGVARCGAYQDAVISACRALADEASAVMKPLVGKKRSPDEEKTYQEASTRYDISWSVFMDAQMRGQSATGPEYDAYREYNETAPGFVALQKIKPLNELEFNPPSPAGTPGAVTPPQKAVDLVEKTALGGPKPDFAKAGKVAEQHLAAGSPADAERVAKLAVERKPDDARGPAVLAETALTRDDPSEAARWAKRALALDPTNKRAKDALAFAEAVLAKSRLKGPGARPGFEEKEAPDTGAAGGVARVPAGSVPPLGAAPSGSGGPAPEPLAGPPHLKLAHRKAVLGDYAGALADLTLALDQNPDDDAARTLRAEISNAMKNPAAGLADAERVLARNPNDARGWRAKADALMQLGRLEEALSAADRALALDAGSAAGHLLRAQILEKLARVDDAVAEYREAARLDPALTPVADEALRRLGRGPAPSGPSEAVRRRLVRGGAIALSLLLVLAGLVGGARVATRRARAATASAASDGPDRTVGRGDTVAGQYTITRELGRGGMGVVFEALDERLKRPVALKQMQSDFRASPEDAARFLQEARLVAQLKHPNVAEIYAAVDDGGLFLVFELIEGKPLDKALDDGPLDPDAARRIVSELCSALAAAHSRRIIHRDLKPSNVMLAADGAAKIMDFGIAHQSRSGAAATQTSASGTPPYMAPEQAMGSVLPASDLYALAVMTYELLCGKRPFIGPDYLGPKMRGEFVPITRQRPALPAQLDAFFSMALSPDPSRRPADALAFRKALEGCWDASMPRTVV